MGHINMFPGSMPLVSHIMVRQYLNKKTKIIIFYKILNQFLYRIKILVYKIICKTFCRVLCMFFIVHTVQRNLSDRLHANISSARFRVRRIFHGVDRLHANIFSARFSTCGIFRAAERLPTNIFYARADRLPTNIFLHEQTDFTKIFFMHDQTDFTQIFFMHDFACEVYFAQQTDFTHIFFFKLHYASACNIQYNYYYKFYYKLYIQYYSYHYVNYCKFLNQQAVYLFNSNLKKNRVIAHIISATTQKSYVHLKEEKNVL